MGCFLGSHYGHICPHCGSNDVHAGYHCPHCNTPVPARTSRELQLKHRSRGETQVHLAFEVTLFSETHTIKARRLPTPSPRTRYYALNVLTGRYLTEERPRRIGLEFETDPNAVERLVKAPFNWLRGSNFVFRPLFGYKPEDQKNQIVPTGWSDECPSIKKTSFWDTLDVIYDAGNDIFEQIVQFIFLIPVIAVLIGMPLMLICVIGGIILGWFGISTPW